MSRALIRVGLWVLFALILAAIARETLDDTNPLKAGSARFLQQAITVTVLAIAAGIVLRLIEKIFGGPSRGRCTLCRARVMKGEIYCPTHLRDIVHEEEDRARA